jgi:hypothetical protein
MLGHVIINLPLSLSGSHHLIPKYHISIYMRYENVISNINIQINYRVSSADLKKINNYYFYYEIYFESLYIPISVRKFLSVGHGNRKFYRNNKLLSHAVR